jgi:hypothetical protein
VLTLLRQAGVVDDERPDLATLLDDGQDAGTRRPEHRIVGRRTLPRTDAATGAPPARARGCTRAAIGSTLLRSPGSSNPAQYHRNGVARSAAEGERGVQGGGGILKYHADAPAADGTDLPAGHGTQIGPIQADRSGQLPRIGRQMSHDRPGKRAPGPPPLPLTGPWNCSTNGSYAVAL